jgi:DNA-directed RNA polymerase specialized sigma24 family protein
MSSIDRAIKGNSLTYREACAVSLLAIDGWSVGELSMTFNTSESSIRRTLDKQGTEIPESNGRHD